MAALSLTRDEAVHRARLLEVASYDLELELTAGETFRSRSRVTFDCAEPGSSTFVELAGALSASATLNGRALSRDAFRDNRVQLGDLRATNELVVDAVLPCVTSGDGMHRYVDPADGETYLTAFCGSDLAQRVFACFDQPDLKAAITLAVRTPEDWTVLGNGRPVTRDGPLRRFATTPPISTYLFVVSAGPWHSVTWEHAGLPFGWHARRSLAGVLDREAAELRTITTACFDHYTAIFDEPYAFDSYDQVMAPGLNWGALETPGCITFRDELLHPGGPSEGDREERAMIVAHEMAHMWFGDLVTLRWWEDIWLNESFADYMGFEVARVAAGFETTWPWFTLTREPQGYAADERRSTHPVAQPAASVVDTDTGFANTDMITYSKGNALLRQLVTWLGEDTFLRGANRYLTAYRFGNADLSGFLEALDAETDRDVRSWADAWLRTTGFDTLLVRREGDVPVVSRRGSRPHRTTVTAYQPGPEGLVEQATEVFDLGDDALRLDDWGGLVVLPNAQDETFARLRLDPASWDSLVDDVGGLGVQQRAVVWATALDLVGAAEMPASRLVTMLADHLAEERLPAIWEAVTTRVLRVALPRHMDGGLLPQARAVLAEAAQAAGTATPALRLAAARVEAACTRDPDRLLGWLADGQTGTGIALDGDLRWRALARLAELGAVDRARLDSEASVDRSTQGETGAARARAAIPSDEAKQRAWRVLTADDVGNRVFGAVAGGLWVPEQAVLVAPYVERYLAEAPGWAERRGQGFSRVIGAAFPIHAVNPTTRDLLEEALTGPVPTVLRRVWSDHLDDLHADLVVRSRAAGPVATRE